MILDLGKNGLQNKPGDDEARQEEDEGTGGTRAIKDGPGQMGSLPVAGASAPLVTGEGQQEGQQDPHPLQEIGRRCQEGQQEGEEGQRPEEGQQEGEEGPHR